MKNHSGGMLLCMLMGLSLAFGGDVFGQSKVGTTAAPFLGIHVGPRAAAMGGTFTAMADDATSLYYNPGAASRYGRSQAVFAHTEWLVGSNFNWVGFLFNMDGANAIGVSLTQLDYGDEEVTTVTQPEGTGELWSASDLAMGVTYSRVLTDRFSIGGTVKYVQQKLWNETASAFAFDVGLLFITPFNGMRLGMSISNFGSDMRMNGKDLLYRVDLDPDATGNNETIVARLKTDAWPLPLFFRVGLAMDVIQLSNSRLTLAADAFRPNDNQETVNVGGEFAFQDMFFLRAGYQSLFKDAREEGLTFGAGLRLSYGDMFTAHLDYAYAQYGLFQDIQMISLGFSF